MIHQYNFCQLVRENFRESTSLSLDLYSARISRNILECEVIDFFIPDLTQYNVQKFIRPVLKCFVDCNKHMILSMNYDLGNLICVKIDETVGKITTCIITAAERAIPNKIFTIRPAEHPWNTSYIRKTIRKRPHSFRKFKIYRTLDKIQAFKKQGYLRNMKKDQTNNIMTNMKSH